MFGWLCTGKFSSCRLGRSHWIVCIPLARWKPGLFVSLFHAIERRATWSEWARTVIHKVCTHHRTAAELIDIMSTTDNGHGDRWWSDADRSRVSMFTKYSLCGDSVERDHVVIRLRRLICIQRVCVCVLQHVVEIAIKLLHHFYPSYF